MTYTDSTLEVVHNTTRYRFEIDLNGQFAVLEYQIRSDMIYFTHTGVPVENRGQGVAALLVQAGLAHAESEELKVVPLCSFVDVFVRRNRQYQSLIA